MNDAISPKVIRRLTAAEGYLELDMPQQALAELDAIDDAGALQAPLLYLRGQALKHQERYDDAIESFRQAAELIPAPYDADAWVGLSECYRERGQDDLADVVEMFVSSRNTSEVDRAPEPTTLSITINIDIEAGDGEPTFDGGESPEA
jgi:tetratricopeptide (TPR) repeat protein